VAVLAVHRRADDLGAALVELLDAVAERDDLGRADEGEVERVEEQDDVLAAVVGELDLLELLVDDGGGGEVRGFLLNLDRHGWLLG
jgi:hypothetical protein